MISAQDYEKKVWAVVGNIAEGKNIHLKWSSIEEARLQKGRITQVQKELRLIKKEIGTTKKAINSAYSSKKTNVGKGLGAGLSAGIFGKKTTGKLNTLNRDNIRREQLHAIAPYEKVNLLIDNVIVQLDQFKLQIESWLTTKS